MKATWERDERGRYTDNTHLSGNEQQIAFVERNADALADYIGVDIEIMNNFRGCKAVSALFTALLNKVDKMSFGNKRVDGMTIFEYKDMSDMGSIEMFYEARRCFEYYSEHIADHAFSIKYNGKIIGAGWCPYINPKYIDNPWVIRDIDRIMRRCMELMSAEFKNQYDMIVLPGDETIYLNNHSITFVFLRREIMYRRDYCLATKEELF